MERYRLEIILVSWWAFKNMGHAFKKEGISSLQLTPDNRCVISASRDSSIKVWEIDKKIPIFTLDGHQDCVTALALTPDGGYLVSGSEDKTVRVWDLRTGVVQHIYRYEGYVSCLAVFPDGIIVTAITKGVQGALILQDLHHDKILQYIPIDDFLVTDIAISPDGRHFFTSSALDRVIFMWGLNSCNYIKYFFNDNGSRKETVSITPDGRHIISGGDRGEVTFWDIENENHLFYFHHHIIDTTQPNYWQHPGNFIHSAAFFNHGGGILSAARDGTIKIWDVGAVDLKTTLTTCVISQDGKLVIAGDEAGKVHFLTKQDFVRGVGIN
jgi:WD40 repeat protein